MMVWLLAVVSIAAFVAIPVMARDGVLMEARWRNHQTEIFHEVNFYCGQGAVTASLKLNYNFFAWAPDRFNIQIVKGIWRSYGEAMKMTLRRFPIDIDARLEPRTLSTNTSYIEMPLLLIAFIAGSIPAILVYRHFFRRRNGLAGFPVETAGEGK